MTTRKKCDEKCPAYLIKSEQNPEIKEQQKIELMKKNKRFKFLNEMEFDAGISLSDSLEALNECLKVSIEMNDIFCAEYGYLTPKQLAEKCTCGFYRSGE